MPASPARTQLSQLESDRRQALLALLRTRRATGGQAAKRSQDRVPAAPVRDTGDAARDGNGLLPCSFEQQRIWLDTQVAGAVANVPNATYGVVLRGALDVAALRAALAGVVTRHESLRTVFVTASGVLHQRVLDAMDCPVDLVDLTGPPAGDRDARAEQLGAAATAERFDLERGPLLRLTLLRLAVDRHVLLLVGHHIVLDERSVDLVVAELAARYTAQVTGRELDLPPLAVRYSDYAAWSAERAAGDAYADRLAYWRTHLAAPRAGAELPIVSGDAPSGPLVASGVVQLRA